MLEFYPQVKWLHVAAVLCSGSLFLLRGLLVQLGQPRLALAAPIRYLSYTIDSVLLTAAMMLATMLPPAVFANGWLAAKLLLLPVYVVLGSLAMRRARARRSRAACYILALAVFAFMLTIARSHQPSGFLHAWASA
jgi:uncharacterized membrane protein SirB2